MKFFKPVLCIFLLLALVVSSSCGDSSVQRTNNSSERDVGDVELDAHDVTDADDSGDASDTSDISEEPDCADDDLSGCEAPRNAHAVACTDGECVFECDQGYSDDDGDLHEDASNGCEAGCVASNEVCDGFDNDCDGETDEGCQCDDGDTYDCYTGPAGTESVGACAAGVQRCENGVMSACQEEALPGDEVCDGVDNNCDGQVDEDVQLTFYADADGDGFGDPDQQGQACSVPDGYVDNADDCDDGDAEVHPDAAEVCNESDDNCDGQVDEGVEETFWADTDGDGFGDADDTTSACTAPGGYVDNDTDCDDTDDKTHPGASEVCNGVDNDCDGTADNGVEDTFYADNDGDGYGDSNDTVDTCNAPTGYVSDATDCDDSDGSVHPGASEVCNGVDTDCDGTVDDGVQDTFYADSDGDGYGDSGSTTQACSRPSGYVSDSTDCDDSDADKYPGNTEVCDGKDNNCDGSTDEGVKNTYYRDSDGDGFGDSGTTTQACSTPSGYVGNSNDCNDNNGSIHPNGTESCNGTDDDCDGYVDEGVKTRFYYDNDDDGYGVTNNYQDHCSQSGLYRATQDGDCNDSDSNVYPGNTETCDGKDNDCDGSTDEGVKNTYYRDADGDGYGNSSNTTKACSTPSGYVTNSTDCDDSDSNRYPGNTETCDGKDNDCDGSTDEGVKNTYYRDADGDGYGTSSTTTKACSKPSGYATNSNDCDDSDSNRYPGNTESCDGKDNDCDGSVDEGVKNTYYRDADGDGYGTSSTTTKACSSPSGYVSNSNDCDDSNSSINPGANEFCSSTTDYDCDGYATCDDPDCDRATCQSGNHFGTCTNGYCDTGSGCSSDWDCGSGETCTSCYDGTTQCCGGNTLCCPQ